MISQEQQNTNAHQVRIIIKSAQNPTLEFHVDTLTTNSMVADLKKYIMQNYPDKEVAQRFQLIFAGKMLTNNQEQFKRLFEKHDTSQAQTIHLLARQVAINSSEPVTPVTATSPTQVPLPVSPTTATPTSANPFSNPFLNPNSPTTSNPFVFPSNRSTATTPTTPLTPQQIAQLIQQQQQIRQRLLQQQQQRQQQQVQEPQQQEQDVQDEQPQQQDNFVNRLIGVIFRVGLFALVLTSNQGVKKWLQVTAVLTTLYMYVLNSVLPQLRRLYKMFFDRPREPQAEDEQQDAQQADQPEVARSFAQNAMHAVVLFFTSMNPSWQATVRRRPRAQQQEAAQQEDDQQ